MNSVTSFFLFILENLQKHHAGNSQQAFFLSFFLLDAAQMTCLHNVCPSKTKTSLVRRVARALAVQLGRSDAEKKPQLVTELLPGLMELFQTEGHFFATLEIFFLFFSFFSSARRENSLVMAVTAAHVPVQLWSQAASLLSPGLRVAAGEEPFWPRRRDCTPPRCHTPWMHEKQKQRESRGTNSNSFISFSSLSPNNLSKVMNLLRR